MPGDVGQEKLEERKIIFSRKLLQIATCLAGRDDGQRVRSTIELHIRVDDAKALRRQLRQCLDLPHGNARLDHPIALRPGRGDCPGGSANVLQSQYGSFQASLQELVARPPGRSPVHSFNCDPAET